MKFENVLDKAVYAALNCAGSAVAKNLKELADSGSIQVDDRLVQRIMTIVRGSMDEGYSRVRTAAILRGAELNHVPARAMPVELMGPIADLVTMGRSGKRRLAAFTMVRNEPYFLRLWCGYYGDVVGFDNVYVLNNSSTDDSIVQVKHHWPLINVIDVPSREAMDWNWITEVVKTFQRACLQGYEAVIYSDVDEFLVPNHERFVDLNRYCDGFLRSGRAYARATGFGVVHQFDCEPSLDASMTLPLSKRSSMWRAPMYDKTLISREPLDWSKGQHAIYEGDKKLMDDTRDPDLSLLHLRELDLNMFYDRHLERSTSTVSRRNENHGSTDLKEVKEYFRTLRTPWNALAEPEYSGSAMMIPDRWKSLIRMR